MYMNIGKVMDPRQRGWRARARALQEADAARRRIARRRAAERRLAERSEARLAELLTGDPIFEVACGTRLRRLPAAKAEEMVRRGWAKWAAPAGLLEMAREGFAIPECAIIGPLGAFLFWAYGPKREGAKAERFTAPLCGERERWFVREDVLNREIEATGKSPKKKKKVAKEGSPQRAAVRLSGGGA